MFTPSPWTLGRNTSSKVPILAKRKDLNPKGHLGSGEQLDALAICYGDSNVRKANARLISKSLEMYTTLLALEEFLETLLHNMSFHDNTQTLDFDPFSSHSIMQIVGYLEMINDILTLVEEQ